MKYRIKAFLGAIVFFLAAAAVFIAAAGGNAGNRGPGAGGAQLLNDRSQQIIGADLLSAPGFVTPGGLTGRGQVVAVADSGIDKGSMEDVHPDLSSDPGKKPRIIMLKSWAGRKVADDPVGHGTHMAGTIAGNGSASGGRFRGVAPEASIYFQGILDQNGRVAPPTDLESLFLPAYQAGARIHVNAWGNPGNSYSGGAIKADVFMRRYPDFLVIFGAGNAGPGANTLTSEANSKNALVVGASVSPRPALDFSAGDTLDPASFSSRGPAGDGRIKPDLLAPGTSIISTRSSQVAGNLPGFPMYTRMQGTSMSAAVTAGSAALLREYMQREMALPDPRAASVKAALINGARTPDSGPSRDGFGVLDLSGVVLALREKTMFLAEENQGLTEGESKKYKFTVESSASPLKVTLAWTDPAGEALSPKALVNNLDLTVTGPDGKRYQGNGFLGQDPDDFNNVEQVYIKDPQPGEYVIEVRGTSVKGFAVRSMGMPAQDFSLVFGQPPATGIIKDVSREGGLDLYEGPRVDPAGKNTHYLFNGQTVATLKPDPGYRVYYNSRSIYITGRIWNPESVLVREGTGGRVWYGSDPDSQEGGYYQGPAGGKGVLVNGQLREDISDMPPGISLEAAVDGATQTLWRPVVNFSVKKGNVSRVVAGADGGIAVIELFAESKGRQVSPGAGYIYNDTFERTDPVETVFGSGILDGMIRIMTGQQVTLVMSPASGVVNSVLVDRTIVSGFVSAVDPDSDRITIGENRPFHVIAGAGVQKNRAESTLKKIVPGDYAVAVILPGSTEIIGLASYSNVVYGRVLFTSARENSVYINDLYNRFRVIRLSPGTEVRRWGLVADVSTLSAGTWVRVILSPDGSEVWRMDVAELLEDEVKELSFVEGPDIFTTDGERYRTSSTFTAVTREGLPVTAGDLLPGEKITLVSLLAPDPFNKVPVAIRAAARESAKKPALIAAAYPENGKFTLTGYTSGDRVYLWHQNGEREDIPLPDGRGAFAVQTGLKKNESSVTVVAVDRKSGAVAGKTVSIPEAAAGKFTDTAGHWAEAAIAFTASSGIMAGCGDGTFRPDKAITGAELAAIRARVVADSQAPVPEADSYTGTISRASFLVHLKRFFQNVVEVPGNYRPPFRDCEQVTAEEKEAIAWGHYWGIIKGRSPDTFAPHDPLTRAEAAAVITRVLQNLSSRTVNSILKQAGLKERR